MKIRGAALAILIAVIGMPNNSFAEAKENEHSTDDVYTPAPGSPERQAIMDFMRLDFYRNDPPKAHRNPDGVFFKVSHLKIHGNWALTFVDPVDAKGKVIAEPRWSLLFKRSGKWTEIDCLDAVCKYEKSHPETPVSDDFDLLDLSPKFIRTLCRAMPEIPKGIFPKK